MNPRISNQFQNYQAAIKNLSATVDQFSETQLTFKISQQTWSILEVFEHLVLADEITRFGVMKGIEKKSVLKKKTLYTSFKSFLVNIILRLNIKIKAPTSRIIPTSQVNLKDLKEKIEISKLLWNQLLESYPNELLDFSVFKHPIAGPITLLHTLRFLPEHVNHHIHQIEKISRSDSFPSF